MSTHRAVTLDSAARVFNPPRSKAMLLSSSGTWTRSASAALRALASVWLCGGVPNTASQKRPKTCAALGCCACTEASVRACAGERERALFQQSHGVCKSVCGLEVGGGQGGPRRDGEHWHLDQ